MLNIVAVIPAYNEETNILNVIAQVQKYVKTIIVVDDGSTDNTAKIIQSTKAVILQHTDNIGKGAALRTGFAEAIRRRANIVITIDADGQHPPDRIPSFLSKIQEEDLDIVVGSRFLSEHSHMPWIRKFTNGTTNFITRRIFGVPITDSQSGYRALKYDVIKTVKTKEMRFVMETELLIKAHRQGFQIGEVAIETIYGIGEESKMVPSRETKQWIKMAIRLLRNKN
jgi:glycosyltransferase involved in cell wall biosynthesis